MVYSDSTNLLFDGTHLEIGRTLHRFIGKMKNSMRQDGYIPNNLGDRLNTPQNNNTGFNDKRTVPDYLNADNDSGHGVVEDHYGGKKLGMTRVRSLTCRLDPINT